MRNTVMPMLIVIIIFCPIFLIGHDLPLKPFTKQHQINSTFAEYRGGTNPHFHQGVDIKPFGSTSTDSFWLVYSILSDTAYRTNVQIQE